MRVVVLVPRRRDHGRRDELWQHVEHRWRHDHPELDVYEGHHETAGPFNRSAAINLAAQRADFHGRWNVAIIADSDSFVAVHQINEAVDVANQTGEMTLAYTEWCGLDQPMSNAILAGTDGGQHNWPSGVSVTMRDTCSSMIVVTRQLWDECEGFDEGLDGWGCEDIIFAHKARTFGGDGTWHRNVPGPLWHLWHEPAPRTHVEINVARADRYHAAAGDRPAMRTLMAELKAAS